jgi:hypothetical protein
MHDRYYDTERLVCSRQQAHLDARLQLVERFDASVRRRQLCGVLEYLARIGVSRNLIVLVDAGSRRLLNRWNEILIM